RPAEFQRRAAEGKRRARRFQTRTTSWRCFAARHAPQSRESERPAVTAGRTIPRFAQSRGAWRFLSNKGRACSRCGQLTGLDGDKTVLHFMGVFKKPALRGTRGPRAIAVVRAAVTWAHKQAGLRKPSNRTTEVRAVDRENLELISGDASHPAGCVYRLAVGRHRVRIPKGGQSRFAFRKFVDAAKSYPRKIGVRTAACNGRKQEAHDRHRKRCGNQAVEEDSHLHEKSAARKQVFIRHHLAPSAERYSKRSMAAQGLRPSSRLAMRPRP